MTRTSDAIGYVACYVDWETGLFYLQSRYYDPVLRRFISADVYMDTGVGILGTNMYVYCNNDPINLHDPTGFMGEVLRMPWWMLAPAAVAATPILGPVGVGAVAVLGSAALLALPAYHMYQAVQGFQQQQAMQVNNFRMQVEWKMLLQSPQAQARTSIINQINWDLPQGNNKRHHIEHGTGGRHRTGWQRFGFDPQGNGGWEIIVAISQMAIQAGNHRSWQTTEGIVHEFALRFPVGVEVVVRMIDLNNGLGLQLSDVIPFIR